MRTKRRALYSVAWAVACALTMVPGVGRAQIDEALTIQPIEVCDPSGACATPDFPTIQAVLNAVWAQAGIAPVLLTPEQAVPVNSGGTGATQVGVTTGVNNNIVPPDGFRLLTRTQGNGQSLNPNTINLFIVDTLNQPGLLVRGVSFINGNGITIGNDAVLDTAAHELGHVLGLDHATPDNNPVDPNNLMTGQPQGTRTSPTMISQIGGPGGLDLLTQPQIDRARQPLFTVGLGRVTSTPFSGEPCFETDTCFNVSFAANPGVTETLNSIVFKYQQNDPNAPTGFELLDTMGIDPNNVTDTLSIGASTVLTVNFAPGTFGQGDSIDFGTFFADLLDGPSDPISVIFNFKDGFASQAGFDAVTGADSGFGSFSFVGTPNYYIPGTCPNDPMTGKPSCFFGPPPTFGEHVDFDPVPEPSTLATLSAGLVGFWLLRRRSFTVTNEFS
jgi:PEP-CTERM motif